MKIFFASLLCFFVLGHIASAQDELRKMMQNAPRLEARVLPVTPVRTIRVGQPMWAPNPDGKSCWRNFGFERGRLHQRERAAG